MVVQAGIEQTYRAVRARDAQTFSPMTLPGARAADLASPDDHRPEAVASGGTGRWTSPRDTAGTFTIKGMTSSGFTRDEARAAGERIGIDWGSAPFDLEQFRMGMDVELEHGARDPQTNVTDDDVIMTAKIARAHLNEFPDYYTRLAKMEAEAEAEANRNAQGE
jgi:Protein of unknown function (DUF5661)